MEDAKDVLQEGFLKIFVEIGQYSGKGSFGGWIRKIFVNTSLDYMRKKNRLKQKELLTGIEIEVSGSIPDMADITADDLIRCIDELPDTHRTVFNLFAVEGLAIGKLPHAEYTRKYVTVFLFQARQLLQKKVTELMDHR